jgi:hypothetical protein
VVGGDAAGDQVERAVAEGQVVHVAGGPNDVGRAPLGGQPRRVGQHLRRQVQPDDGGHVGGQGQRRVAGGRGHVEGAPRRLWRG